MHVSKVCSELAPHHLARPALTHAPEIGNRFDDEQAPAAAVPVLSPGEGLAAAAVVDLHAYEVLQPEEPEQVAAAGRGAVEERVGGELAHAEQRVVLTRRDTPGVEGVTCETPCGTDGSGRPEVELLPQEGRLDVEIHEAIVARSD
ncbi:hypothetical protein ADK52_30545 [Streptomyces sp. WM6372]|nr:hypothetical protein ADK52_30545 [Streptomyces sp. WM6372]